MTILLYNVSVMTIDRNKIKEILEKHDVSVAYLFGSAVKGNMGPHSDIDIGVIFKNESNENDSDCRFKIASEISDLCGTNTADIINVQKVSGPLIKYNAVFSGELLFSNDDNTRFEVERAIVREYEDTKYLRKIASSILREELGVAIVV